MATRQESIDTLVDSLAPLQVRARKMFGEYALYIGEKIVALVCDEELFVKPTAAGAAFLDASHLAPPYPGAKPCLLVPGDRWTDRDWLAAFLIATEAALPVPPPRKPRVPKPRG